MDTQYFPHFIRANFPQLSSETNEVLIDIGEKFKKHLEDKFSNEMHKLDSIWNIDPIHVIKNRSPFSMNGYHPALLLHFMEFVEAQSKS